MDRILKIFTKDRLLVNLLVVVVTLFGIATVFSLKREVFPPTELDKMIISVSYPGASPTDVELNAVVPIEDELKEITGIDEYTSICVENSAKIMVELDQDLKDKQSVKDEIFRTITLSNITEISDDVEEVVVTDLNPKLKSVYSVSLSPKEHADVSEKELYSMSELLKDRLYRVNGVSEVSRSGYKEREVHINVDPRKMEKLYVSLNDIVTSIQSRNIRSSGGTIQSVQDEKTILTIGQFEDPLDVGQVIIRSGFEQSRVTVNSVAEVKEAFEDVDKLIHVNQQKSVVLEIKKKENADIITTVDNVKNFFEKHKDLYSDKFDITVVEDESESISSLIDVVISNAVVGYLLVILVLFVFLDFKTSFWTAFSIPFTLFATFICMYAADYSLNIITLGAVITVLGMLVDDAIVIAEVIYEQRIEGKTTIEAAIKGVKEVAGPVFVTILSTIVAFLPLLMIKGIMGKFIAVYPIVITITLLISLFEAIFILPNHLVDHKHENKKVKPPKNWFKPIALRYKHVLQRALKFRYIVLALFIITLIGTIIVSRDTIREFVLFWDDTSEELTIDLDMPGGSSLENTEQCTLKIEEALGKVIPKDELVSIYATIGTHAGHFAINKKNWSTVQVKLVPIAKRDRNVAEVIEELRTVITTEKFKDFTSIVIRESKKGPPTGDPVDIKVISHNVKDAKAVVDKIYNFLSNEVEGVFDLETDETRGKDEVRFIFDYTKMAQFGIDVKTVASTVRTAYEGNKATTLQSIEGELDFLVQIDERFQKNENFLMNLLIPNDENRLIKIRDIARLTKSAGQSSIAHYNGYRAITISGDVNNDITTPIQVNKKVQKKFKDIGNDYPGVYLIYGGETEKSNEALSGLSVAFILALLLIYLIVVFLFRSFIQPFVVLSVIPFGIIGVLLAFTLHGIPLSFMGLIGVVGLSGVVINDSIIMVEFVNKSVRSNRNKSRQKLYETIAEGAQQRLRPIILTTITTVAGLLPTIYGIGGNAKTLVPTVMAMAYGLLFASFLTLVFVPCLYMISVDVKSVMHKLRTLVTG